MLESYLRAAHKLARFRSSPAGPYLDGFAVALRERGYCRLIGASCIGYAVHLSVWAEFEGFCTAALHEGVVDAFEAHLSECCCPGQRAGRHTCAGARARMFVDYLRTSGVVPAPVPQVAATPELVAGFCEWMRRHRGVTDRTLRVYRRMALGLVARLGDDPGLYSAGALRAAVRDVTDGHGVSTARHAATVGRAFVRYLVVAGRCRPGLDAAIPPTPRSTLASLPRYVTAEVVQRIIDTCDPVQPSGARDRAILLLLSRLGLRGGDIVDLRLRDIDWKDARVRVDGKGRREVRLPLPQEVGDAILAYLHGKRPVTASDHLFLTVRAPLGPLADSTTVARIVKRAIERAGVSAPTHGAHLLRHSAATAMLREGISLPAIGALLRHRSVETTAHYAKVDVDLLRSVAQPWLGDAPC